MAELLPSAGAAAYTLAVFAAAAPVGDPDWEPLMTEAGALLADKGVRVLCLVEEGRLCLPLIAGARAAGGEVLLVADDDLTKLHLPAGVVVEAIDDAGLRLQRFADLAEAFVGLPASVIAVRDLHRAWVEAGGGSSGKPVALLNRNRAYEALRGYAQDVLSHSLANSERLMVFADSLEDLWTKLARNLKAS